MKDLKANTGQFLNVHSSKIGVNTDTRLMSDVSPTGELWALHEACGITWEEIGCLVENAIASSFAPLETRRAILDEVVRPAYASLAEG